MGDNESSSEGLLLAMEIPNYQFTNPGLWSDASKRSHDRREAYVWWSLPQTHVYPIPM